MYWIDTYGVALGQGLDVHEGESLLGLVELEGGDVSCTMDGERLHRQPGRFGSRWLSCIKLPW